MPVLFDNIPGNIRVPLFYAEFRPGGTPYVSNARVLLVGQKLSTGLATANSPIMVRDGQASGLFGSKSMLEQMYNVARRNGPLQEIWALPVDDLVGGVKAAGAFTISGAPVTQAGVLAVYIAGRRVRIGIGTSDTNANLATALAAAITAADDMPVTAAVDGVDTTKVVVTARHKGTLGNAIILDLGTLTEDGDPPVSVAITAMTGGSGDPDLVTAFGNLGDDEFDWIGAPYSDATNLGRASDLLNDISGRWSYARQIYGHYLCTNTSTVGSLSSLGNGRNDQHASIFPCRKFLSTPWEVAAAVTTQMGVHLQSAPELSRPLQTLKLIGIKGPRLVEDRLTKTDRQTLYFDGISGYMVQRDGTVCIERVTTTYQSNAWGDPDWTYLDVETMAQSMFGIRFIRTEVTSKHGRHALARDNPGRLPHIVTPIDIRNTVLHAYSKLVRVYGVFENETAFAEALVCEVSPNDPNRVDVGMSLDHVNQLRIVAAAAVNYMQLESGQSLAA